MDFYSFYTGASFDAYEYLGGHLTPEGAVFRTFAPSAEKVSLIGAFSDWQELPMERVHDGNFWECFVPGARAGMMYKYRIYTRFFHCIRYHLIYRLIASIICIVRRLVHAEDLPCCV